MTVNTTSSLPSALPPIASTGGTSSGTTASSTLDFTQNFNTFLTLLTTQLQNQDPLSPMDSSTFTQQLVSFSEVEQQIDTNNNLQSLIQLQTAGETISAMPLVGDTIEYNSATAPLQDGQASFSYTLPTGATQAALAVTDSAGNVIYSTTANPAAGTYNFTWNGQNNSGQQMPNGGAYTLEVVAANSAGDPVTATVQSAGTVSSVNVTNGQASFDVGGVTVPMSELVTVNPSNSTASN